MGKMKCALRHANWLTALFLGALLLIIWCQPGRTEHLGADFAWMAGMKGRGNQACCEVLDCVETTVALLEQDAMESTVMIGDCDMKSSQSLLCTTFGYDTTRCPISG